MNSRDNQRRDFDDREAAAQLPNRNWLSPHGKMAAIIVFAAIGIALYILSKLFLQGGPGKEERPATHASKTDIQWRRTEPAASPTTVSFSAMGNLPNLGAPQAESVSHPKPSSSGSLFAFAAGDDPNAGYTKKAAAYSHDSEDGQLMAGDDDALSSSLRASNTGKTAKAHVLKHPRLTVTVGTEIPCVLKTKIDTTLTGFVVCESRDEVRGAGGGTVTLLPRWTRFTGQIRRGLTQYEDRISIVWTKVLTPDDIEIDINSPATDMLGAAGVDAQKDNHIGEKIGAVLLYTVIEAGPALAVQALQNQSNTGTFSPYSYNQVYQPSQQVAGDLLRQKMQRPPIAIKNQGEEVMVMVAQNWDLSDVISLEAKE